MIDSVFDRLGKFHLSRFRDSGLRVKNLQYITDKCYNAYLGDYTNICRILGRFYIYIDSRDRTIGMHLLTKGFWEIQITECIAKNINHGMTVIDLGASYGYYSVLMAGLIGNQAGTVYSIEANPVVFKMLTNSIGINSLGNKVQPINVAVIDRGGQGAMQFNYRKESTMNGHLDICKKQSDKEESITVTTNSLDNLIPPGTQVDFIKVDIEGSEHLFWKGSKRIRSESPSLKILLEFNAKRYSDAEKFVKSIIDEGFSIKMIKKTEEEDCFLTQDQLLQLPTSSHVMLLLEK